MRRGRSTGDGAPARFGQVVDASQFPGTDLGAKITAATSALPVVGGCPTGTVSLEGLSGTQTVNTTIALTACNSVNLRGPGKTVLTLNCAMNGDCIQIRNANGFATLNGPIISGFNLQGNSGTNAVGIRYGDVLNGRLDDIDIGNFTGTNSVGLWMQNGNVSGGYRGEDRHGEDSPIILAMGSGATFTDLGLFQFWPKPATDFMNINGTACGASTACG